MGFPHSEFVPFGILFFVLGVALLSISIFWPRGTPAVTGVAPLEITPLPTPAAEREVTGAVTAFSRTITWPSLIDESATDLSEPERRALIEGLALVASPWCAQILVRAFDEETGDLRVAAIEALAHAESDLVAPTLERAYASHVIAERYAAIDTASRSSLIPLLERALRDTDGTIALAAAYGLHQADRNDLIEEALCTRTDARANEIRKLLPILSHIY